MSGVEVTHPDKGTEMFLYELAVDEPGAAKASDGPWSSGSASWPASAGCYGMWVITDDDNRAARSTYGGTGASAEPGQVVYVWTF